MRDRTHFFGGYEHTERDLSGARGDHDHAGQPGGARPERAAVHAGGAQHRVRDRQGRSPDQPRATGCRLRYIFFDNFITNNIGGGLTSVQRGTDFTDRQHSTGAQLISTHRGQRSSTSCACSTRRARRAACRRARPAPGPAITITNVANFGGPIAGDADAGFAFTQDVFQVNDNLTHIRGDHAYKFGFDMQTRRRHAHAHGVAGRTRSRTLAAYQAARQRRQSASATRRSRSTSARPISSTTRISTASSCRTTGGYPIRRQDPLRRPLRPLRRARAAIPTRRSRPRAISVSTRTTGRRASGVAWTLGESRRSVIRANTGIMYDQALLAMYEQSLINDGTNRRAAASFQPTTPGAPGFPERAVARVRARSRTR